MKNITNFLIFVFLLTVYILPSFVLAQEQNLVPCGTERSEIQYKVNEDGSRGKQIEGTGDVSNPCTYTHVFELVNNIVDFILKKLAVPIAAIGIFYAGILMVFSGGSDEQKGKAKKIFTGIAIGLIFVAGSWLLVKTVLSIVGYKDIGDIF
ncbi:MAG: pilin [bacterium]|nr:pilin [bacterium]